MINTLFLSLLASATLYIEVPSEFLSLYKLGLRYGVRTVLSTECEDGYHGFYDSDKNTIVLCHNENNPYTRVLKHELAHAAQDCKAGFDNNKLAILYPRAIWPKKFAEHIGDVYSKNNRSQHITYELEANAIQFVADVDDIETMLNNHCKIKNLQ